MTSGVDLIREELKLERRILDHERQRLKQDLERVQADLARNWELYDKHVRAASVDTHPKDGDVEQAPLGSGAVPKADAHGESA